MEQREAWFRKFDADRRPLWVHCDDEDGPVRAWLSLRSFCGRPAYKATVETGVYVAPTAQRRSVGRAGFAEWGRLPRVAELDRIERDLVILGRRTGVAFPS